MMAARRHRGLAGLAVPWLLVALAGCTGGVSREIVIDIEGIGMEYLSGQIRSFLDSRGYRRTRIENNLYGDDGLFVVRTAETEIMHFRSRQYPNRLVVTHLDKRYRKIYLRFTEQTVSRITPAAREEFNEILAAIMERVGVERVEAEWW